MTRRRTSRGDREAGDGRPASRGALGLSLLEILVVAAILVVVAGVVWSVLRYTVLAETQVGARQSTQTAALVGLRKIADTISEARHVLYPLPNDDGSPRTLPFLVIRTFEEETVFFFLDEKARALKVARLRWAEGKDRFERVQPETLAADGAFRSLSFTVAGERRGREHVRMVLRTSGDDYFECARPWSLYW